MSKRILIIGSNGYVGSRLRRDLQMYYDIHCLDICWFGINSFDGEVADYRTLTKDQLLKYDAVILLAAHSSVKMCEGPIIASWSNNVNNFLSLIEKLDESQLLIYASSGSVYGSSNIAISEDSILTFKPINNYDLTKYSLDLHARKYIEEGRQLVGLRFGTVNGWSPHIREELMINSMVTKSIKTGVVTINNKNISRPIIGINDISRAMRVIIEHPRSGIYNLASFCDTVQNIGSAVATILGTTIVESEDMIGVYNFNMNTRKFRETYNFEFNETMNSIVDELINTSEKSTLTTRNQFIAYE